MFENFLINCGQAWLKRGDWGEIRVNTTCTGARRRELPKPAYSASLILPVGVRLPALAPPARSRGLAPSAL